MGERAKKLNSCAHCDYTHESHAADWHADDCALGLNGYGECDCCKPYVCADYLEQRIFRASPSSVKTFQGCTRRWAAKALGGIRKETDAQRFGTKLHEYAEHYLATGEYPDQTTPEGRLMVEGIPFLPKRRLLPEEIEGEVAFDFGGVPWIGYYDWKEFDIQLIGDHKSSADPKKWGLTTKDLPNDLQAAMYAFGSGWDETSLKWVYYGKKSKTAYPVEARITREHARQIVEAHAPAAREMQKWFNAYPEKQSIEFLNTVPNDPSSCDHCGRNCDFADHCELIKPQSLVRIDPERKEQMNDRIAALKAKIEAKKSGENVNPPESAGALAETEKEVKNDPSNPAENPDAAKDDKKPEPAKTESSKPAKTSKEKPAASSAPAGVDGYVTVMVPRGAQVTVTFSA